MRESLFFLLMAINLNLYGHSYDMEYLSNDLRASTDIVIAKKVSGVMALGSITNEIDQYQQTPINWRNSPSWELLQKRNSVHSTFLVMNTIKGEYKVGEQFEFNDGWLPVKLGSVKLYFLNRKNGYVDSEPCLRIPIANHQKAIVSLSADAEALIAYLLKEELSGCDREIKN